MNTLSRRGQLFEATRGDLNPAVAFLLGKPERSPVRGAGFQHDLVTRTCLVEGALEIALSWNRNEATRPSYLRDVNRASRARRCLWRSGITRGVGRDLDPGCR
jgi:hypothetical protein